MQIMELEGMKRKKVMKAKKRKATVKATVFQCPFCCSWLDSWSCFSWIKSFLKTNLHPTKTRTKLKFSRKAEMMSMLSSWSPPKRT